MRTLRNGLTFANVLAAVALFLAMSGAAIAVTKVAKNSVTSRSIKNASVTGKDVKDDRLRGADIDEASLVLPRGDGTAKPVGAAGGELVGSYPDPSIADNAVDSPTIVDGAVEPADLARMEPYRPVGGPGELQFSDGGEGDCVWHGSVDYIPGTAPVGYAKDVLGQVHLRGILTSTDGPGGDGKCKQSDPGEAEDGLVFVLPADYRPSYVNLSGLPQAIVVAPDAGAAFNGSRIAPGGVVSVLDNTAVLDGLTFEAAAD